MDEKEKKLEQKTETPKDTTLNKMPKNTVYFLIGLVAITILLLILAVYNFNFSGKNPFNLTTKPSVTQSKLTITKPVEFQKNGKTYYISGVNIDAGSNQVNAVEVHLTYDPSKLSDVDIIPSSYFSDPQVLLKKIDTQNGTITYSLTISRDKKPRTGPGSVAFITFTTNPNFTVGTTDINFSPKTLVTALGIGQSVLYKSSGTTLVINNN